MMYVCMMYLVISILSADNCINKKILNFCNAKNLATSRLANIFGNGTIYRHDKKLKRAKTPEINQRNRAHQNRKKSSEGLCASLQKTQLEI